MICTLMPGGFAVGPRSRDQIRLSAPADDEGAADAIDPDSRHSSNKVVVIQHLLCVTQSYTKGPTLTTGIPEALTPYAIRTLHISTGVPADLVPPCANTNNRSLLVRLKAILSALRRKKGRAV